MQNSRYCGRFGVAAGCWDGFADGFDAWFSVIADAALE
jgi:hypothetical protein